MWNFERNIYQYRRFASICGIYISSENSQKLKFRLLRILWLVGCSSSFPLMVFYEEIFLRISFAGIFQFQMKFLIEDSEQFTVEQFNVIVFVFGGIGTVIQSTCFSYNSQLFDEIVGYLLSNALKCKRNLFP